MKSNKTLLIIAAVLAGSSVLIGAFAAHALKAQLSPQALGWIDTGVQYQQFHSLALLILAIAIKQWPCWPGLAKAAYSFIMGTLLFSGSLYFFAITGMAQADHIGLALLTPLGGLAFLIGWAILIWAATHADTDFGKQDDR